MLPTMTTRFSPETLRQIRDRVSLVEVVRQAVPLKRKGHSWWACCPFHNEKSPSFHVRDDEGFYHCFGCGAHGNVYDFIQQTKGMSFPEAVEYLAPLAGVTLEREKVDPAAAARRQDGFAALERTATFFQRHLTGSALAYAQKRGLKPETLEAFRIGFAPDAWRDLKTYLSTEGFNADLMREAGLTRASEKGGEDYDAFRGRLMFPIFDLQGRPVGFGGRVLDKGEPKYLNSSETPFFHKSRTLYGLHHNAQEIRRSGQALLVEGYMDVVSLWQHGVKTALAPLGTAVTEEQIELLWRYVDSPIVCLDGDAAGQSAALRAAERALKVLTPGKGLRFLTLPEGEDPDSLVSKKGANAFNDLMDKTESLEDVLWRKLAAGRDLNTAEGRAAVDAAIGELGAQTTHATVKRHLMQVMNSRLWQSVRGPAQRKKVVSVKSDAAAGGTNLLLLAILLYKPTLIARVEEAFARLDYAENSQKMLQKILLRAAAEKGVETPGFDTYLSAAGMKTDATEIVSRCGVIKMLADAGLEDDATIETFWFNIHRDVENTRQQKRTKQAMLDKLGDSLAHDPDAWRQFMAARNGASAKKTG